MSLRLITPATARCVTQDEIEAFLRVTAAVPELNLFTALIKTAERYAENYMKRSLMQQTWRLTLDAIPPGGMIELPRPPLITPSTANVTFTYVDSTGGTQTMPSTCYTIDAEAEPARIYQAYDADWPTDIRDHKDVITIEYNVGATSATAVGEPIKTWIKLRVGAVYENREALMVGTGNFVEELPRSYVDGLLDEFCIIEVG